MRGDLLTRRPVFPANAGIQELTYREESLLDPKTCLPGERRDPGALFAAQLTFLGPDFTLAGDSGCCPNAHLLRSLRFWAPTNAGGD